MKETQELKARAGHLAKRTAKIVSEAYKKTTGTISISALVLLWAASRATMALRCGLNKVYDKEEQRTYPVIHLISIGYTIAVILLFIIMLFLVFAGRVSRFLIEKMPDVFDKTGTIAMFLFWLYWCFYILLIGGYFNRFCGERWDKITGLIGRKNR